MGMKEKCNCLVTKKSFLMECMLYLKLKVLCLVSAMANYGWVKLICANDKKYNKIFFANSLTFLDLV